MKKITCIIIWLIAFNIKPSLAQQNRNWLEWRTVYEEGVAPNNRKIEISFSPGSCHTSGTLAGTINKFVYWRLRSNFNRPRTFCKFSFDVVNCDGKIKTEAVTFNMEKSGVFEDAGKYVVGYEAIRLNLPAKIDDYNTKPKTASTSDNDRVQPQTSINNNAVAQQRQIEIKKTADQTRELQQQTQREQERKLNQERIAVQMNNLSRQSQNQANMASGLLSGISSLLSANQTRSAKTNIASNNSARERQFDELKRLLQSGNGEIVDCTSCDGEGYEECRVCRSNGYKTCSSCKGHGGDECTVCRGTGKGAFNMACINCFGKGVVNCLICGNSGKEICTTCDGLGQRFCTTCTGTGKKFNRIYDTFVNSQQKNRDPSSRTESKTIDAEEQKAIEAEELRRSWLVDKILLEDYLVNKETSQIPGNVKQVYYIVYQRNYPNGPIRIRSFKLNRYSNNTWMQQSNLWKKLNFEPYLNPNGIGLLLGFYTNIEKAKEVINAVKKFDSSSISTMDDSFILLN